MSGIRMVALSHFHQSLVAIGLLFATAAAAMGVLAKTAPDPEQAFVQESQTAMDKMMARMVVTPSGDVDADFAAVMIPHHQGAIEMAQAELRYGRNERLRRIAQEIVVDQQQEIIAMRLALGQTLPASIAAPDDPPRSTARSSLLAALAFKICTGSPR